jgi:hypothetical protein
MKVKVLRDFYNNSKTLCIPSGTVLESNDGMFHFEASSSEIKGDDVDEVYISDKTTFRLTTSYVRTLAKADDPYFEVIEDNDEADKHKEVIKEYDKTVDELIEHISELKAKNRRLLDENDKLANSLKKFRKELSRGYWDIYAPSWWYTPAWRWDTYITC